MNVLLLGGSHTLLKLAALYLKEDCISELTIIISPRHEREVNEKQESLGELLRKLQEGHKEKFIGLYILKTLKDDKFVSSSRKSDLTISISAAWIYNEWHIQQAKRIYQMHNTLLPSFRGGASVSWQILCGQRASATTLFEINEGIDTGKIVYSEPYIFPETCRKPCDYGEYSQVKALKALVKFLRLYSLNNQPLQGAPQQESFASYFPRLKTDLNGCIDWSWKTSDIERFLLAFDEPYKGAFSRCTAVNGRVHLKDAVLIHPAHNFHPFQSGIIYKKDDLGLYVCCSDAAILIRNAKTEAGDCLMEILEVGDRFYNTTEDLMVALATRPRYSPKS